MQEMFQWVEIYVCAPLYILGRVMNLLFALIIVLHLMVGHRVHVFTDDVPMFQTSMLVAYLVLVVMWATTLKMLLSHLRYVSYILPSSHTLTAPTAVHAKTMRMTEIKDYYETILVEPYAKRYCAKLFGKDIAVVIMEYYGFGNVCEDANERTDAVSDEMARLHQSISDPPLKVHPQSRNA